jgi:hypothetical protein
MDFHVSFLVCSIFLDVADTIFGVLTAAILTAGPATIFKTAAIFKMPARISVIAATVAWAEFAVPITAAAVLAATVTAAVNPATAITAATSVTPATAVVTATIAAAVTIFSTTTTVS